MKAISIGRRYEIYDDSLKTYDELPAQTYIVKFSKMSGFYLEEYSEFEIKEDKIYGIHKEKADKVLRAFKRFDRSLGVILSGDKGIGKSLFAKLLSIESIKKGLPVIIVDSFVPGIANYLEDIKQEVVVLFDEFDKTFANIRTGENEADPQAGLLSLFDGISQGKKLFIITCNEIRKLNDYLINRPGRFHYHFRFEYPCAEEIKVYLEDKLEEKYHDEIDKVIVFSKKIDLNYDCLRAIAFELNSGEPFKDAIKDLNIVNTRSERYNIILYLKNGQTFTNKNRYLDLFGTDEFEYMELYGVNGDMIYVEFNPADCKFDSFKGANIINPADFKLSGDDDCPEDLEKLKVLEPDYIAITKCQDKSIHYTV